MLEIESLEYDKDYFAKGRWGKVYKGRYNKSSVCVKEIKKSPAYITDGELIKALLKECSTLKRLDHPCLTQFIGVVERKSKLLLVSEYISGTDISRLAKDDRPLPWYARIGLAYDIASGLLFLHTHKVYHGDLKSADVLLQGESLRVKVGDIGFARVLREHKDQIEPISSKTRSWKAPERSSDEKSDVYELGIVLVELITRHRLSSELLKNPLGNYNFDIDIVRTMIPSDCPPQFSELALQCCLINPIDRPSCKEVVRALKGLRELHPGKDRKKSSSSSSSSHSRSSSKGDDDITSSGEIRKDDKDRSKRREERDDRDKERKDKSRDRDGEKEKVDRESYRERRRERERDKDKDRSRDKDKERGDRDREKDKERERRKERDASNGSPVALEKELSTLDVNDDKSDSSSESSVIDTEAHPKAEGDDQVKISSVAEELDKELSQMKGKQETSKQTQHLQQLQLQQQQAQQQQQNDLKKSGNTSKVDLFGLDFGSGPINKEQNKAKLSEKYGTMQSKSSLPVVTKPKPKFASLARPKAKPSNSVKNGAVLVIDNGSSFMKAGVSGEELPRSVIPPVIGQNKDQSYIGFKAWEHDGLKMSNVIDVYHNTINWDKLTDLWEYLYFDELQVDPENHPLLVTELPDMTRNSKLKMAEILFELFQVPALHIANQAVMALYSLGSVTGIVVDCGSRMQIVPVIDGYTIDSARYQLVHGNLTEYLARLLTERGHYFSTQSQLNNVRKIKEKFCYVALDFDKEMKRAQQDDLDIEAKYTLPDGKVIELGNERFRCPEALFDPSLMGIDRKGLHQNIHDSVMKSPMDSRMDLYSKVVLAGGSTLFPGFAERLQKELGDMIPLNMKRRLNIIAPHNRKYSAWFGGSVFGTLGSFYDTCIWKDVYLEEGERALFSG